MTVANASRPSSKSPTAPHMLWIDALRGFAAIAVALFHGMIVLWVGLRGMSPGHGMLGIINRTLAIVSIPLHYGYAAVMLFFLLSGFVIHLPYAGGRRPFQLGPYFVRRFLRIYPPYLFAIMLSVVVAAWFPSGYSPHLPLTNYSSGLILKAVLLIQNYPHAGGPMAELASNQPTSNLSLWSLPVEMELYLAYPLILLARKYFAQSHVALLVIAVSFTATLMDHMFSAQNGQAPNLGNYIPTFLHFWAIWAAGAWLAEMLVRNELPRWKNVYWCYLASATALALLCRMQLHVWHDAEDYVWGCVFFFVFLRLAQAKGRISNLFIATLAKVGTISYSMYLIHIPIFLVLSAIWAKSHQGLPSSFGFCIVAVVLVIPIAAAMYALVEKPSISAGRFFSSLFYSIELRKQLSSAPTVKS